jgi:hypothetical protein
VNTKGYFFGIIMWEIFLILFLFKFLTFSYLNDPKFKFMFVLKFDIINFLEFWISFESMKSDERNKMIVHD